MGVEVGPAGVADEQRVAGQDEPRLVGARQVGDDVGVMGGGVSWCCPCLEHGVAEFDQLAVGEFDVGKVHAGALGQVGGGAGAGDEVGESGDVIGLHVRLEHGDDRDAWPSARAM